MTEQPLLAAESIGKTFRSRRVLNSASLWVRSGSITALVGRNGEGKSTLLKVAAGLLKPDFGSVRFRQEYLRRVRLPALGLRGLFFLPEQSLLSKSFTLNAHLGAIARRFGGDGIDRAVEWLQVGALLEKRAHTMSGGEKRRADLAIAVARQPECLLADEPFLRLAPRDAELFAGVFRRLADAGCAVAVSGHEVPVLFDVADEVVWMTAGTTHVIGTPAEAREHRQFRREYLGVGASN